MHKLTQLGEQIRKVAKENDITLKEMCVALRLSQQQMTNICRGKANPSFKILQDIAKKYNKRLMVYFLDN